MNIKKGYNQNPESNLIFECFVITDQCKDFRANFGPLFLQRASFSYIGPLWTSHLTEREPFFFSFQSKKRTHILSAMVNIKIIIRYRVIDIIFFPHFNIRNDFCYCFYEQDNFIIGHNRMQ